MGNRQHRILFYLFSLLLPAFFMASCAVVERPLPPDESEILWETKTPAQILAHLRKSREKITDLTAAFSLSVDPPPEGQPSNMRGIMFFARRPQGPCVRIKCLGLFGRVLFDLVQKGDDIRIYVPSRHTLFLGRISREKGTENVWGQMFRTMFSDLSDARVSERSALLFSDDMVIVPLVDGEIRIARQNGLVRQWHHGEKIIAYDQYDQKPGPGLPPIPTHIALSTKDGAQHAVCRLSQVSVNRNISDVFDLSAYEPKIVRDLKELGRVSRP